MREHTPAGTIETKNVSIAAPGKNAHEFNRFLAGQSAELAKLRGVNIGDPGGCGVCETWNSTFQAYLSLVRFDEFAANEFKYRQDFISLTQGAKSAN